MSSKLHVLLYGPPLKLCSLNKALESISNIVAYNKKLNVVRLISCAIGLCVTIVYCICYGLESNREILAASFAALN